jgi:hypothetical protein
MKCDVFELSWQMNVNLIAYRLNHTLNFLGITVRVWSTRPSQRGMRGKGVSAGTFFCGYWASQEEMNIVCLKNFDLIINYMPCQTLSKSMHSSSTTATGLRFSFILMKSICHLLCHGFSKMEHSCTELGICPANP